ncbi:MAG: hypothetical protein JRD47_06195 [Deltaproteobacteria bacterium]|nr:hypothetical protein [Deltaproteobacteria bacterium]
MMNRDARQYVLELDGHTYLCSGNRLEEIAELKDVAQGDQWFISDFQKTISRMMTIEAPVRYAELMVQKKLQESGEFDEPVSVLTHWKKKAGRNTTHIFFTAFPIRLSNLYFQQIKEHEDNILLFPLFSVLHGVLRRTRHSTPVALVFQHDRFADLIIGTKKTILYANRCVAFDTSEEQMSGLWDTVRTDITTLETENRIKVDKIFLLNWIDSGSGPKWSGDMEKAVLPMEEEEISFNGKDYSVSFFKAVRMQSAFRAVSSPLEKISCYSQRLVPCLNIIFLLAILLCGVGYLSYSRKAERLERQLMDSQGQIATLQQGAPLQEVPYKETLSFVRGLARCRKAPSYKTVVNDISEALPKETSVEVLKVDYTKDEVEIEIFGKTKDTFDLAYNGYQRFIDVLVQRGYTVAESQFDTEIRQSQFLTRFMKKIQ